jgi:hypothetical protein
MAKVQNERHDLRGTEKVVELFTLVSRGDQEQTADMIAEWNTRYAGPCMADKSPVLHF